MSWEASYDKWKMSPPEERDSNFRCDRCKDEFHAGDRYYELDDQILCTVCAHLWVDDQCRFASYEQCYGDERW